MCTIRAAGIACNLNSHEHPFSRKLQRGYQDGKFSLSYTASGAGSENSMCVAFLVPRYRCEVYEGAPNALSKIKRFSV